MTDFDFRQICELSDDLLEHGETISEYLREVVVPYNGKLYKVQHETTMNDILEGESVTVNIFEIISYQFVDQSKELLDDINSDDDNDTI